MQLKRIPVVELLVNSQNDRHGELADERSAFEWLLSHRQNHMRNLARDIAREGKLYELPLVRPINGKFVVHDGNRRVACLKLLSRPSIAPNDEWRMFFRQLESEHKDNVPKDVLCQVEHDLDAIDEILYRRHTGTQSGVGQSPWGAPAKANFVARTGKKTRVNVAEEAENKLKEKGMIDAKLRVSRSNLNRLLSSEPLRNRVGIRVARNKVELTHDENKVLGALQRIVEDLKDQKIVLTDIWRNTDKHRYLDKLEKLGILPTADHALLEPTDFKSPEPGKTRTKKPRPGGTATSESSVRTTLIPRLVIYDLPQTPELKRINAIWRELQYDLNFSSHGNSIAVLFRVLLELSVEHYISINKNFFKQGESLAQKFKKVADQMYKNRVIEKKYFHSIGKFDKLDSLISAHTFNQYVHSNDFFPSDHHLKAMWDTLERFVLRCLDAHGDDSP